MVLIECSFVPSTAYWIRDAKGLLSESCKFDALDDFLTLSRLSETSESPDPIEIGLIKLASLSAAAMAVRLAELGLKARPLQAIGENPLPLLLSSFRIISWVRIHDPPNDHSVSKIHLIRFYIFCED
nr:hypothetical protein Iba_chr07bCG12150 [Ipomoea batatas]